MSRSIKVWSLLPLALIACTAITAKTGYQCESTADCKAKEGTFSTTVCKEGFCQPIAAPPPPTQVCASHVDCSLTTSSLGRCINQQCVPLPKECEVRGNTVDDNGVLLGVLRPATPGSVGTDITRTLPAVVGAIADEWNTSLDKLKGTPAPPRVGLLICDEGDIKKAASSFRTFGVKAIVGPLTELALQELRNDVKGELPILSPMGEAPSFKETSGVGQPYFCTSNLADAVQPFAKLVQDATSATVVSRSLAGLSAAKVALVHNSRADGEKVFLDRVVTELAAKAPALTPSRFDIDTVLTKDASPNILVSAAAIVRTTPDVVVMSGGAWSRRLVNDIEARWSSTGKAARPVYVVMRTVPDFVEAIKSFSDTPRSVYAVDVDRPKGSRLEANYGALLTRLAAEANSAGIKPPFAAAAYNDCMLAALYGVFKAQALNRDITAPSLGAEDIFRGIGTAGGGGTNNINLTTLLTDMDGALNDLRGENSTTQMTGANAIYGFNGTTHVPNADHATYCLMASGTWGLVTFTEGSGAPTCVSP